MMLSIIICTYNRSTLLDKTLKSFFYQDLSDLSYEVLIIDNNSKDNTYNVFLKHRQNNPRLKYFLETEIGLSYARNRGYKEARGAYIGYTDDDCEFHSNWLKSAVEIIRQDKPLIFGGPVYPFYLPDKPDWYKDEYAIKSFGLEAGFLNEDEFLIGCNIFLQKKVLFALGGFDGKLGMNGKITGYGEETDLQMRFNQVFGPSKILYSPLVYVKHLVRPEQMTFNWLFFSFLNKGKDTFFMLEKDKKVTRNSSNLKLICLIVNYSLKGVLHFMYGLVLRDRKKYKHLENYLFERTQEHLKKIGFYYVQIQ